jgi:hypothetical protein
MGESRMPDAEALPDIEGGPPLMFGIYPGMTGQELPQENVHRGPTPDDPERTERALALLQPGGRPFLVRSYVVYTGRGRATNLTPAEPIRYARDGRRLDFVACYRSEDGDLTDWVRFVRDVVRRYGPHLDALQVTEEANNPHGDAGGDGSSPNVRQALVEGVVAAKDEARRCGLEFQVGFAATPSFNPGDDSGLTHRFCIGNTDPVFSSVFREVASRGRKDREASRRYRKRTRPWMSMLRVSSMA